MFGLGLPEIIVIFVIVLILFGAKKLPQIGEGLGKTLKEIRKIRDERKADRKDKEKREEGSLISDLKREAEEIPGVKEAREIKETADKVRSITKFLK